MWIYVYAWGYFMNKEEGLDKWWGETQSGGEEMNKVMQYRIFKWGFWVRIKGKGFWLGKDNGMAPLFSERYGYKAVRRFLGLKYFKLD